MVGSNGYLKYFKEPINLHANSPTLNNNNKAIDTNTETNNQQLDTLPPKKERPPPKNIKPNSNSNELNTNSTSVTPIIQQLDSIQSMNCENGGIGFQGECICPYAFSGERCEIIGNDECINPNYHIDHLYIYNNVSASKCVSTPSSVCCWNKYRSDKPILPKNLETNQHNEIKRLLQQYGPWNQNDKTLFKYLFKSSMKNNDPKTEEFSLSIHNYSESNQTSRPNLAFFLLLHEIDMEAIKMLFTFIYRPKHFYVIHIDKNFNNEEKLKDLGNYFESIQNGQKNIKLMDNRFYGSWGSISLVYAEIAGISMLLDMANEKSKSTGENQSWSHLINLSINDFPTKPMIELEKFLGLPTNINRNFLNEDVYKDTNRITNSWVECERQIIVFNFTENQGKCGNFNDVLLHSLNKSGYVDGSQWHFLTRKFSQHLVTNFRAIERLLSLKFSLIPDETFFQVAKSECNLENMIWDEYNYRYIPWMNPHLEVNLENIQSFKYVTYFTRKVYKQHVKQAIADKYLNFRNQL
eukprot:gene2063-2543_t